MNGATAEPWLKTINIPNKARTIIIGNNQYFFLSLKNSKNSFKKSIIQNCFFIEPKKFFLIQYVSCFFENFNPIKSLPNILTIKLIGVRTIKYTKNIIIGAITFPRISPNFTQDLFKGDNIFELIKPRIKNNNETSIK